MHRSSRTSGPAWSPRGKCGDITSVSARFPRDGCWITKASRRPTPAVLYEPPLGTILPLGGAQSYKGFGLALILELWAGGLSGGRCSDAEARPVGGNNVLFVVFDPEFFAGKEYVSGQASRLGEFIRATPRLPGVDAILLPGEPERIDRSSGRSVHGIPLDAQLRAKLSQLAAEAWSCTSRLKNLAIATDERR